MHRHRPKISPLGLQSPEQDLCEISMQLDREEMPFSSNRIAMTNSCKLTHLEGWIKTDPLKQRNTTVHASDSPESSKSNGGPYPHESLSTRRRNCSTQLHSYPPRLRNTRQDLRRTQSQDLSSRRSTFHLKESRQFYHSEQSSPILAFTRKKYPNNARGNQEKQIIHQQQLHAVNYPILELGIPLDHEQRLIPLIGKIRHLINTKAKRRL